MMASNSYYEDLPIMNIGGFFIGIAGSADRDRAPQCYDLADIVGREIMARGHRLVSGGCSGGVTQFCAEAAASWLKMHAKEIEIKYRIISIVPEQEKFAFINLGQFLICKDRTREERRPLMTSIMDALITISGGGGTRSEGEACLRVGTPVIPTAATGGASRELYSTICKAHQENPVYKNILTTPPWKKLEKTALSYEELAVVAVDLAEIMADLKSKTDRSVSSCRFANKVFVIMPFKEDMKPVRQIIEDIFESKRFNIPSDLTCTRVEETLRGRIDDSIAEQIHKAPFVIADLTGNNPNVLYELGYSLGIGKRALLINQSPADSAIDIANLIQIPYDLKNLGQLQGQLVDGIKQLCGPDKERL
jgi:predicted Rossmann-fold nucleotide-binding protein